MKSSTYHRKRRKKRIRLTGLLILVIVMVVFMLGLRSQRMPGTWEAVNPRSIHQAQKELRDHPDHPKALEELLEHNPETAEFVRDYEKEVNKEHRINLAGELLSLIHI